jgi:hypothetical protein
MINSPSNQPDSSSSARQEAIRARSGTHILAEGMSREQTSQLLAALIHAGKINGIGTPSRDEIINPKETGNGGLSALGGLLQGGDFDQMMIEMSIALVTSRGSGNSGRCDIALTRMPMAGNSLGVNEICVAQVYEASEAGQPMVEDVFQAVLSQVAGVPAVDEAPQTKLHRALQATPTRTTVFASDLSAEELSIRLSSLVRNNRVNSIVSPNGNIPDRGDVDTELTLSEESVRAHVKRVCQSASGAQPARYRITLAEYDVVPGIEGRLVAASLSVDTEYPQRSLPVQPQIVAENLSPKEAADALAVLWEDRKLDLLMVGSASAGPGDKAMYPVGFKDESGQVMTAHQVLASMASRLSRDYGNVSLDIYISKQDHGRRSESGSLVEGEGFLVILLANDQG